MSERKEIEESASVVLDSASSTDTDNSPDTFGGCPICGGNDGFLNIDRGHWFMCNKHKTKWCIGSNWFRCWRFETEDIWKDNFKILSKYREVECIFPDRPKAESKEKATSDRLLGPGTRKADMPSDVLSAIECILEYLWDDEKKDWQETDVKCRDQHIFSSLITLRKWLDEKLL